MIVRTMCAAVALIWSAGAGAAERDFGEAGGTFHLGAKKLKDSDTEHQCIMITEPFHGDGGTQIHIFRETSAPNFVFVGVANWGWSSKKDEEYALRYIIDDYFYDRTALGAAVDSKKGFVAVFPADEFLSTFAAGSSFKIMRGDVVVDHLSLFGSSAAVARFRQCYQWAEDQALAARREKERYAHITKDPFADK